MYKIDYKGYLKDNTPEYLITDTTDFSGSVYVITISGGFLDLTYLLNKELIFGITSNSDSSIYTYCNDKIGQIADFAPLFNDLKREMNAELVRYIMRKARILSGEKINNKISYVKLKNGDLCTYLNDKLHSYEEIIDGVSIINPALIGVDGHQFWYENGLLHRIGNPAVVFGNDKQWWKYGIFERFE